MGLVYRKKDRDANKRQGKRGKEVLLLAVIAAIALSAYLVNRTGMLSIENIRYVVQETGPWGVLVFMLLYIIVPVTNIPASIFTIAAGVLFDLPVALTGVVIAATIAASIGFFIARHFSAWLVGKTGRFTWLIRRIERAADSNGFVGIAVLRLSFLPYMPLSYAAGLVRTLRARDFILATFLTNIFGGFVFIALGASFTRSIPLFLGAIVLVILFMQVPKIMHKVKSAHNDRR